MDFNKHQKALQVGKITKLLIKLGLTDEEAKMQMVEILKKIDNK